MKIIICGLPDNVNVAVKQLIEDKEEIIKITISDKLDLKDDKSAGIIIEDVLYSKSKVETFEELDKLIEEVDINQSKPFIITAPPKLNVAPYIDYMDEPKSHIRPYKYHK